MSRLPGSVCTVLRKWDWVDTSTLCRVKGQAPGTIGKKQASGWVQDLKRLEYLGIARSVAYSMQGKSLYQSVKKAYQEWEGKKKTQLVQSYLGGQFLRMYLDGRVDQDVVNEAGEEIGESQEFESLTAATQRYVQSRANRYITKPFTEKSLVYHAEKYLKARKKGKRGIAFKRTLNTVIGGVTNVEVGNAKFISKTKAGQKFEIVYEIEVIFHDEYDFENKRFGYYDKFRKKAARSLIANDFEAFEELVFGHAGTAVFDSKIAKLDDASVFASFMYALEKKGWTPGPLAWKVGVPTRGKVKVKT